MTKQVQLRRGTSSEHALFAGAVGELTIDTTLDVAVVHDGTTQGGHYLVGTGFGSTVSQALVNKSFIGIGTTTTNDPFEFVLIGDALVEGSVYARNINVFYDPFVDRSATISDTNTTSITGISTNNIKIGYSVENATYISVGTTVTSIGIGSISISTPHTVVGSASTEFKFTDPLAGQTNLFTLTASEAGISSARVNNFFATSGIVTTAGISSARVDNFFATSGIVTTIGITSARVDNFFATSGIVTTIGITSARVDNFFATSGIVTTAGISSAYILDLFVTSGIVTNAYIENLFVTSGIVTTAGISSARVNNFFATSGIVTGLTVTTLLSPNAYITSGIITDLYTTTLSGNSVYINSGIVTTAGISSARVDDLFVTSGIVTTAGISSARVDDLFVTSGIVTTIGVTSARVDNFFANTGIVTTSIIGVSYASTSYVNIGIITNAYISSGIVTNLSGTNVNFVTGTFTGANITTGIITSASGTNLTYTTADFDNVYITSGVATDLYTTTLSANTAYINVGIGTTISTTGLGVSNAYLNVGFATNFIVSSLTATQNLHSNTGIITNLTGTNLSYSGVSTLGIVQISSGIISATSGIVTYYGNFLGIASEATKLQNARTFEITGDIVGSPITFDGTGNVSIAATIQPNSVALGTDTTGDYVQSISGISNEIEITVIGGTGESSTPTVGFAPNPTIGGNVTIGNDLQVNNNLNVTGNITIGGTTGYILAQNFRVSDADIVLGFTTDSQNNDISTDITANHGGIAIASTEGNPLINLNITGIETLPATYKKIMWFKAGAFAGLNTDAWLSNYAIGIGSTQFPIGTRLAAGSVQFSENDLAVVRNINSSGIITASNFSGGDISGTTGTFSSQIQSTQSNNISTGGGQIYLNGSNGNRIDFNTNGTNLPSFTTRSTGTKVVLYPSISGSSVDYSLGISPATFWNSIPSYDSGMYFKWFGGETELASLSGIGSLSAISNISGTTLTSTVASGTAPLTVASTTQVSNLNVSLLEGYATATANTGSTIVVRDASGNFSAGIITASSFSGSLANTLTLNTSGTGLSGSTTFNNSSASTFTVTSNATSANTGSTIVARDASGNFFAGIITATSFSGGTVSGTTGSFSSQITSTQANDTTTGGGQIYLNGSTGNRIDFAAPGVAAPAFTTRSVGTKLVLYPGLGASSADYGFGIESSTLWSSVPTTSDQFKWYAGTTHIATLSGAGNLTVSGTVTANSDIKLKKNIETISDALDKVLKLRGVTYDRIDSGDHQIGVIAQEIESVVPELVYENNGTKSVAYSNMVGLLIEAIKEQQVQINELRNEIKKLKSE